MRALPRFTVVGALVAALVGIAPTAYAEIDDNMPRIVSESMSDWTPTVQDGEFDDGYQREIWDFALAGSGNVIACGKFGQARPRSSSSFSSGFGSIMMFQASGSTRGQLGSFKPIVGNSRDRLGLGTVNTCEMSYDGGALIIGGSFDSVNGLASIGGQPIRNLAKIRLRDQAVMPFAYTNAPVTDLTKFRGQYLLAGSFTQVNTTARAAMASVSKAGTTTSYFRSSITGNIGSSPRKAYRFTHNAAQTKLVVIGSFTAIDGKSRRQLAVFNASSSRMTLASWIARRSRGAAADSCTDRMVGRDVAIVPGTSDFIWVSTGGANRGLCDVVMRFSMSATGVVDEKWRTYTRADTLHSVAVAGNIVYAAGHQKETWSHPGVGSNRKALSRVGIHALGATTGRVLAWRSDQPKCVGGKVLFSMNRPGYPVGLLAGTDCDYTWPQSEGGRRFTGNIIFRPIS